MSEAWIGIVGAVITGIFSLLGVMKANSKTTALISYRLEQLEKKQDKHNNALERLTRLEGRVTEAEHEISDLKRGA